MGFSDLSFFPNPKGAIRIGLEFVLEAPEEDKAIDDDGGRRDEEEVDATITDWLLLALGVWEDGIKDKKQDIMEATTQN